MSEATFTFRVEETLKSEFFQAAKAKDRTGAQILRDFMRQFVQQQREAAEHDAWFRRQVQIGLDSANAGDLMLAEEVDRHSASWRMALSECDAKATSDVEQSAAELPEPAFLDDEGPSSDLPPFPTTTNIRQLYGWRPGESLDEAIARHLTGRDLSKPG